MKNLLPVIIVCLIMPNCLAGEIIGYPGVAQNTKIILQKDISIPANVSKIKIHEDERYSYSGYLCFQMSVFIVMKEQSPDNRIIRKGSILSLTGLGEKFTNEEYNIGIVFTDSSEILGLEFVYSIVDIRSNNSRYSALFMPDIKYYISDFGILNNPEPVVVNQ